MNTPTNAAMRPSDVMRVALEDVVSDCRTLERFTPEGVGSLRQIAAIADNALRRARELDAAQSVPKDREKDRKWFIDPAFNRWLDEGISDAGHTVYDTIGSLHDAWLAWQAAPYYCAAQPAQAGEPVYQVKFRTQGSGWVTVDRESYESPLAYLPEHYERRVAYLHPQPEQPASAVVPEYRGYAALGSGQYIINHSAVGEVPELAISIMPEDQRGTRTVGDERDNEPGSLVQPEDMAVRLAFTNVAGLDALEQQLRYLRAVHFQQSPAVSPPSVVAVSEEASVAFDAWWRREMSYLSSADRAFAKTAWCAALESFASRMGSGERDAADAARYRWIRGNDGANTVCPHIQAMWANCKTAYPSREEWDAAIDAAIAKQNKRGGA